jgi:hypothetical protein
MTQGSLKKFLEHNMGNHKMTISPDSKHIREKFLMACTCGTEGRFVTQDEAKAYASMHATHYGIPLDDLVISDKPTVYPGAAPVAPAGVLPITQKVGAAVTAKGAVNEWGLPIASQADRSVVQPAKQVKPGAPDPNVGW